MVFSKVQNALKECKNHQFPDVIETIYQDYDGNVYDEENYNDFVWDSINYYCMDFNECDEIVKNYGYIKAIKSYIDEYGDADFLKTDTKSDITCKLAFHLITDTFWDIDFNTFEYYAKFKYYEKECLYDEEYYDSIEDNIKRYTYNKFSRNWHKLVYF
tara:strand:- start:2367 stop:2840 length:474 start_codon:yes stop_codon:yes gene_type:complete